MGKKYLDTKQNTLEAAVMKVWQVAAEELDKFDKKALKKDFEDRAKEGDGDLDNDGDEDDSDKYLHHKLGTTAKKTESVNESYVVIDPRGNARPVGSKIQGDRYVKGRKGHYVILAKNAMKARRAIEKAGGRATSRKVQDLMYDLRFENTDLQEAPKMKVYSWEKDYKTAVNHLVKANNIMKMKSPGGHKKIEKQIAKVMKALSALKSQMQINSTEF